MSRAIADNRMTTGSPTAPSRSRLRMQLKGARGTVLDGGWWPRSTDPVAELPGLVLAIDELRGPVVRLVLASAGWDSHPRRLRVADRVLRLGYFHSQPVSLLTALCGNGERVDLLVVAPHTTTGDTADAAMLMAATVDNLVHAQHILTAAGKQPRRRISQAAERAWETEGGHLGADAPHRRDHETDRTTTMQVDKAEIVAVLRLRGLHDRADWVDRALPALVDTDENGSLLRMLHIEPGTDIGADVDR